MTTIEQSALIKAIEKRALTQNNISFDRIRQIGGRHHPDIFNKFSNKVNGSFGTHPLISQSELEQYLYQYGLMIKAQWQHLFVAYRLDLGDGSGEFEIIDYACGQGLATVLFFDGCSQCRNLISKITLIEPSDVALNTAKAILQCYTPNTEIALLNKKLDDVTQDDIQTDDNAIKLHLFSNILDVEGFDVCQLFNKILASKGLHYILAVSHNRDFKGGAQRLRDIYSALTGVKFGIEFDEADFPLVNFDKVNARIKRLNLASTKCINNSFKLLKHKIDDDFKAREKPAIFFGVLVEV